MKTLQTANFQRKHVTLCFQNYDAILMKKNLVSFWMLFTGFHWISLGFIGFSLLILKIQKKKNAKNTRLLIIGRLLEWTEKVFFCMIKRFFMIRTFFY